MTDIVDTLRQWARDFSTDDDRSIFVQAADKIERLRSELEQEIAERCAQIAEEWIIPAERLGPRQSFRRTAGVAQNYTAREIAVAIRERKGTDRIFDQGAAKAGEK